MPKIQEIIAAIECALPLRYQEKWDNSGLQVGDARAECSGVLLAVEATEATVEEAAQRGYNLLITHHPILFHPLARITPATYVERTVARALRLGVAIYAAHTSADNVLAAMNGTLARRLGLQHCRALVPSRDTLYKLDVTVPSDSSAALKEALFAAGAGQQGDYSHCCFTSAGMGEFLPLEGATPTLGKVGHPFHTPEDKLSLLVGSAALGRVIAALRAAHPYEEPAYDLLPLHNSDDRIGSGLVGELPEPLSEEDFLRAVAQWPDVENVAHSALAGRKIRRVALCSGSGGSFLEAAHKAQCQVLLTGEAKYNHFLDAAGYSGGGLLLVCIGHYESETVAREIFREVISASFANFAVGLATSDTNPVHYWR